MQEKGMHTYVLLAKVLWGHRSNYVSIEATLNIIVEWKVGAPCSLFENSEYAIRMKESSKPAYTIRSSASVL